VLVANLGHQPRGWLARVFSLMRWPETPDHVEPFIHAVPLTAYNAATAVEIEASRALVAALRSRPGGQRLEQVMWAASGSEAVQKALWAALARDPQRPLILATRHGFHGKKGLAGATSGTESDPERDDRVQFIAFPMAECADVSSHQHPFDPLPYQSDLDTLWERHGKQLGALITEPYLGAAGSFHPPPAYLQLLQRFCREHDLLFILDEVQANFGRTRCLFAFEAYGLEPDVVVLGKGLGNGMPVAAVVGPRELFSRLALGVGSDTYSGHPLGCAAALATLEAFADGEILAHAQAVSPILEAGLARLKVLPFIRVVRGEPGGMVWGVEFRNHGDRMADELAAEAVKTAYRGDPQTGLGIHLLGPLAGRVVRIAPPLVLSSDQALESCELLHRLWRSLE
jgi:4-aminobutyrate aminotransferase-like enzyme